MAFFLGSYTGILLTSSNQPLWANTTWLGALFLASALSTGLATLILLAHWWFHDVSEESSNAVLNVRLTAGRSCWSSS